MSKDNSIQILYTNIANICLLVNVIIKISPFLSFMRIDAFLDVVIQSLPFRRDGVSFPEAPRLVITSSISAGTGSSWSLCRPVDMWCDSALNRIV